jgi:hypothetical protein
MVEAGSNSMEKARKQKKRKKEKESGRKLRQTGGKVKEPKD